MPEVAAPIIGLRDRVVTLEQVADTVGASQFPLETWAVLAAGVYAESVPGGGGENFVANQTSATAMVTWRIPYRADCDPDLVDVAKTRRVVAGGRVYDILDAIPIGRRRGLELRTRAKVG